MSVLGRLFAWWCVWDAWRRARARRALEARGREYATALVAMQPPELRRHAEPYAEAFGFMSAWLEREGVSLELPS